MLQRREITPKRVVDARKQALDGEQAWPLLAAAGEILVAGGKHFRRFDPRTDSKEAILAQALGRSGTLRAPTLKVGDRLLVGYSDGLYTLIFG